MYRAVPATVVAMPLPHLTSALHAAPAQALEKRPPPAAVAPR